MMDASNTCSPIQVFYVHSAAANDTTANFWGNEPEVTTYIRLYPPIDREDVRKLLKEAERLEKARATVPRPEERIVPPHLPIFARPRPRRGREDRPSVRSRAGASPLRVAPL